MNPPYAPASAAPPGDTTTHLTERPSTRFTLGPDATATSPAEQRGRGRDDVKLLVARPEGVTHRSFGNLAAELMASDIVVVNDSATVPAQLDADLPGRGSVIVHAATPLDDGSWVIEVRTAPDAARAILDLSVGDRLEVGQVVLTLAAPYPYRSSPTGQGNRLWRARADGDLAAHARRTGRPIAYGYLERPLPLADYQTVFSRRPGSAEMPSAGRGFTPALVTELVSRGVAVVPITLHTGVSSQEAGEGPQPERFEVPAATAALVNAARAGGSRVVAVGTTVTRALESAVVDGRVTAAQGWTERVVTPAQPPQIVTGLITGWHDPGASHLLLVEAVAGPKLTQAAYDAATQGGYLWHEFGDAGLLLP